MTERVRADMERLTGQHPRTAKYLWSVCGGVDFLIGLKPEIEVENSDFGHETQCRVCQIFVYRASKRSLVA